MGAVELLIEQHREIDELFERFASAKKTEKEAVFDELLARLVAHDEIERELFYPACERILGKSEPLTEGLVEHSLILFTLFRANRQRGTDSFEYLVRVLEELVQHHVDEEEAEILTAARQMGEDMLEALGKAMGERHAVVLQRDPSAAMRRHVERLIAKAPPSRTHHPRKRSRKVKPKKTARPRAGAASRRAH